MVSRLVPSSEKMSVASKGLNKKIAKNTLMLYIRMFVLMGINLYTGRILLATLGVEDYGIYSIVASFVATFSVISGAMVGASQRFLSFELGRKNGDINNIFSTIVSIHIVLSLIIVFVGEIGGYWIVNNLLNISFDRLTAANWVFQFSLISFVFNIISIPYNALIVAKEKMKLFAYIGIIEAILKLVIVYFLSITSFDKLIFYAFLMLVISVFIRSLYSYSCHIFFKEIKYNFIIDRLLLKKIFSYTGWNFFGSIGGICRHQGINLIMNVFFGTTINAAYGVASHASSALTQLITNFQMAMNPQIVKRYSAGDIESMFCLIFSGTRLSSLLYLLLAVPIYILSPFLLSLWLENVPEFSVIFFRLILCVSLLDCLSRNLIVAMQASGIVAKSNIFAFFISVLNIPIIYILFRLGYPAYFSLVTLVITSLILLIIRAYILKQIISFPIISYCKQVLLKILLVLSVYLSLGFFLYTIFPTSSVLFNFMFLIILLLIGLFFCWLIGLNSNERVLVAFHLKKFLHR